MIIKGGDLSYLCVVVILLIVSYKFLDATRKVKQKFSARDIFSDFSKRVAKNTTILKNIMSGEQRNVVNTRIEKIKSVIKNPNYFSKPCFDHENVSQEFLGVDHEKIKNLVRPLRIIQTTPRIKIILNELANDYEALINLSRNSFCQNV